MLSTFKLVYAQAKTANQKKEIVFKNNFGDANDESLARLWLLNDYKAETFKSLHPDVANKPRLVSNPYKPNRSLQWESEIPSLIQKPILINDNDNPDQVIESVMLFCFTATLQYAISIYTMYKLDDYFWDDHLSRRWFLNEVKAYLDDIQLWRLYKLKDISEDKLRGVAILAYDKFDEFVTNFR